MGLRIGVQCDGCGYRDEMFVGVLRSTPFKKWQWPMLCGGYHSIPASYNNAKPLRCLRCGSDYAIAIDDPMIYAGDGEHEMQSWFGAELPPTGRMRKTRRMEHTGWRGSLLLIGPKLFGQDAYYETNREERQDDELQATIDGNCECSRCDTKGCGFQLAGN